MSYCRFSTDDFQCDVYVWADVSGGWRTEVAGRRWIFNELPEPVEATRPCTGRQFDAWFERHQQVAQMVDDETQGYWLELPTPDGGNSYWHDTPGECADNLQRLQTAGFNVPQDAIDTLREESP